jgi:hypothetical protein
MKQVEQIRNLPDGVGNAGLLPVAERRVRNDLFVVLTPL